MIKSITVINPSKQSIKLELTRPDKTGLLVERVDGLGPTKASINTTQLAMYDGGLYNSAYLGQRNIVIKLRFLDDEYESIEDIRHKTYKYFPIKKEIELIVETDKRTLRTKGHVESNEPDIFSDVEGSSISIICEDPYFYSMDTTETSFYGVDSLFEFPLENPSTDESTLVLGNIRLLTQEIITYDGDFDAGMTITIHATGSAQDVSIHNITTGKVMRIDTDKLQLITGEGIVSGDTIIIETELRDRKIMLIRNGEKINIRNCLGKSTDWLVLSKGDNVITCDAEGENGIECLQFHISNKTIYEGV